MVPWILARDHRVCANGENPVPEDLLFPFEAGGAHALPTAGL